MRGSYKFGAVATSLGCANTSLLRASRNNHSRVPPSSFLAVCVLFQRSATCNGLRAALHVTPVYKQQLSFAPGSSCRTSGTVDRPDPSHLGKKWDSGNVFLERVERHRCKLTGRRHIKTNTSGKLLVRHVARLAWWPAQTPHLAWKKMGLGRCVHYARGEAPLQTDGQRVAISKPIARANNPPLTRRQLAKKDHWPQ